MAEQFDPNPGLVTSSPNTIKVLIFPVLIPSAILLQVRSHRVGADSRQSGSRAVRVPIRIQQQFVRFALTRYRIGYRAEFLRQTSKAGKVLRWSVELSR